MDNQKNNNLLSWLALIGILILFVGAGFYIRDNVMNNDLEPEYVSYTDFLDTAKSGTVFAVYPTPSGERLYYQLKKDIPEAVLTVDGEQKSVDEVDPSYIDIYELNRDTWYYTNYKEYDSFKEQMLLLDIPILENRFVYMTPTYIQVIGAVTSLIIPLCLLLLLFGMFRNQMPASDAKYEVSKATGYKFSDVIGHDEIIEDVRSYIDLLQNTKALSKQRVKPPKGILFTGNPGTGKTLLAKAMAGEAKVPFIYLNTSNVIEMYVGVGARTIRSCFKKARELAPCVVFLDEIDAIGGGRGRNQHGTSEDTQTLLALLQELDGFSETEGILVIAATNCPETLDKALTRSGRFDREIVVNPPRNRDVRLQLLEHYTKDYDIAEGTSLADFAAQLAGMTGADIANICNEAAIIATLRTAHTSKIDENGEQCGQGTADNDTPVAEDIDIEIKKIETATDTSRYGAKKAKPKGDVGALERKQGIMATLMESLGVKKGGLKGIEVHDSPDTGNSISAITRNRLDFEKPRLTMDDFTEAMDKLLLKGNRVANNTRINSRDREVVAYHEAGHAVISYLQGETLSRITIQGTTSGVGGFVMSEDKESQFRTLEDLYARVRVAYAGRSSEKIKFGDTNVTTGASNDIQQATKYISNILLNYGFDAELGMLDYNALLQANIVDKSVVYDKIRQLSTKLEQETDDILKNNYYLVEKLASVLLDVETMTGTEAMALLDIAMKTKEG